MNQNAKEKIDILLSDIDKAKNSVEASLCLHRFLVHNDWCPKSAYERALRNFGHVVVWAGEVARATSLPPARLWKVFSPSHEVGLARGGWTLSMNRPIDNGKDTCPPTPGSLKDGTIIYGMPPWPPTKAEPVTPAPTTPPEKQAIVLATPKKEKVELAKVVSALHQAGVNGSNVDELLSEAMVQWQDGRP